MRFIIFKYLKNIQKKYYKTESYINFLKKMILYKFLYLKNRF